MLVRLLYASQVPEGLDDALLRAILRQSMEANPRHGITGLLCADRETGVCLQALEGGRQRRPFRRTPGHAVLDDQQMDVLFTQLLAEHDRAVRVEADHVHQQCVLDTLDPLRDFLRDQIFDEFTHDGWTEADRIPGHQLQITNDDRSRTYAQIHSFAMRLYIIEARAAPGATPPIQYQQSVVFLDEEGEIVRYDTDFQTRIDAGR